MLRNYVVLSVIFLVLFSPGCGNKGLKTDVVTGKVTFNGEPLEGASVRFSPVASETGNIASGMTDKDGLYKLQTMLGEADAGTTPGEYIVTVSKSFNVGTGRFQRESDSEPIEIMDFVEMIPAKYSDKSKSELRFTVVAGKKNEYDIPLEGTLKTQK